MSHTLPPALPPEAARILFEERDIRDRLEELAAQISRDYRGRELTVVAVLNGSLIFAADLMRRLHVPVKLDCLSVASYHGGAQSSGRVTFNQTSLPDIRGRHVLIVDDILDTGRTLQAVRHRLRAEGEPASVRICVLLRKAKPRAEAMEADYIGFDLGDEFVVGYGLDYHQQFRNWPFIATLREEYLQRPPG